MCGLGWKKRGWWRKRARGSCRYLMMFYRRWAGKMAEDMGLEGIQTHDLA